jgi:hypothetical protein
MSGQTPTLNMVETWWTQSIPELLCRGTHLCRPKISVANERFGRIDLPIRAGNPLDEATTPARW